ncbi:MAG: hypothetical protein ACLGHZ_04485 [Actinomycetes bacterium]
MITRRHLLAGATAGTALLAVGCTASNSPQPPGTTEQPRVDPKRHQVTTRTPASDLVVPAGPAGAVVASRELLAAATAVVVIVPNAASPEPTATPSPTAAAPDAAPAGSASPSPDGSPSATATPPAPGPEAAASVARALGIPLFEDSPELAAELDRLQTRTVIAYGGTPQGAGSREVVAGTATAEEIRLDGLPTKAQPAEILALGSGELAPAVAVTLASAGLEPTSLAGPHPGVNAESTALVKGHEGVVVAAGDGFGTAEQFARQVEVTRTASELPGGGVAPFPGRRMIALYGHPQTASLGMMGEQPPAEAVARVKRLAEEYQRLLPGDTVIGAFEIITTVASSSATSDGDYSYETPIELIMPWVEAAEAGGLYVVLDLQPGRTDFLTQAKRYEELLRRPGVGLALDPEWRLPPNGKHLVQVGQVGVDDVNAVGAWLADFVAENKLPPKVLTLHQFQTRMVTERSRLVTDRPEVQYLVHVDGQGGQAAKQSTWGVIKRDLPAHTWLGWKNFEDEDIPMLTPKQTVDTVQPTPYFISYQ